MLSGSACSEGHWSTHTFRVMEDPQKSDERWFLGSKRCLTEDRRMFQNQEAGRGDNSQNCTVVDMVGG